MKPFGVLRLIAQTFLLLHYTGDIGQIGEDLVKMYWIWKMY